VTLVYFAGEVIEEFTGGYIICGDGMFCVDV